MINLSPDAYDNATPTNPTLTLGSSSFHAVYGIITPGADGDRINWKATLQAGTYSTMMISISGSGSGIINVVADGTTLGSFDTYSASDVYNARYTNTNVSIATSGPKTISTVVNGKNGSSSGFRTLVSWIAIWKTD